MKYLVSHQGEERGPFGLDEIVSQVRAKDLDLFDYILDHNTQDWVLLMEHPELAQRLKSNKPPRPPATAVGHEAAVAPVAAAPTAAAAPARAEAAPTATPASPLAADVSPARVMASAHNITDWFLLKGDNRFGPFSYEDVVHLVQQKIAFPFDLVWHAGLPTWQRLAELPDFNPETIRRLFSQPTGQAVFVPRRFKRAKYSAKVILHDNMKVWRGTGVEISQGGVGIAMGNAPVAPGQKLTVHFSSTDEWPAFNAVCEVVSKKWVNDNSPVEYGLRFLSLSQDAQEQLMKKVA